MEIHASIDVSLFEKVYGHSHTPDYSSLWVFGCTCFSFRNEFAARSLLCVLLDYGDCQKGYRCSIDMVTVDILLINYFQVYLCYVLYTILHL